MNQSPATTSEDVVTVPPHAQGTHFMHPICEVHGHAIFKDPPRAVRRPVLVIPDIQAGPVQEITATTVVTVAEEFEPTPAFHFVSEWEPDGPLEGTGSYETFYENRRYSLFAVAPVRSVTSEIMEASERRLHADIWVDAKQGLMAKTEWEYRKRRA